MNLNIAGNVIDRLVDLGVREFCVCAGARSSPFVVSLSRFDRCVVFRFFEERSAGFFALGRMKQSGRPVAVVTTSGTAVAELLPAVIESFYSGLGLVALTADRPMKYRGTGAPQTIEQRGIFSDYAFGIDLDGSRLQPEKFSSELNASLSDYDPTGPLHLNVGFDEPLLSGECHAVPRDLPAPRAPEPRADCSASLTRFLSGSRRPFAIVGSLEVRERAAVADFLIRTKIPAYCEATSGLREDPRFRESVVTCGERIFQSPEFRDSVDSVVRLGGVPTSRLWRDLEGRLSALPVLSLSALPFSGLSRGKFCRADVNATLENAKVAAVATPTALFALDRRRAAGLEILFSRYPESEPAWVRAVAQSVGNAARVYLGNSLPIREWDLAAPRANGKWEIGANRGANGIDGQTSTFFGFAEAGQQNWALLGDLTALYDLSAPWILSQMPKTRVHLVVINNGGGKIFERMFRDPAFQNQHAIVLGPWAEMWGLEYRALRSARPIIPASKNELIEIFPDPSQTESFWKDYEAMWEGA